MPDYQRVAGENVIQGKIILKRKHCNFACILKLKTMQKTRLFKSLLFAIMPMAMLSFSVNLRAEKEQSVILLKKDSGPQSNPGAPRTPSATIIEAYYDSELLSVCVYFSNAGDFVDVNFENLDTGETAYYSVAGSGGAVLPISGNAGLWQITFTLSNGDEYVGEFLV